MLRDNPTCPTGGDPTLSILMSKLSLALAEGELQAGLEQHRWKHRETSREAGHMGAPGKYKRILFKVTVTDDVLWISHTGLILRLMKLVKVMITGI